MKKKRVLGKILIICFSVVVVFFLSFSVIFIKTTWNTTLSAQKLEMVKGTNNVKVFNIKGEEMDTDYFFTGKTYVNINELPEYVKQAFIATEDRRFYKHNGVDYKRILGSVINNIKSGSFSQGGSTISQQLIKNTHLTREKTINRKFKEIKLAYELENKYSKDEILEMYLNNIYFGNGCYGLEKASNYYFNKKAKDLSVGEVAMMVGVINAPSVYDPISKTDNAENRKKLVLKLMKNQKFISKEAYEKSANSKENIVKNNKNKSNMHLKNILDEACRLLKVSANALKNMNINIQTYIDDTVQSVVEDVINNKNNLPKNKNGNMPEVGIIVLDNKTKGVVAVASSGGNVMKNKRQPGSTIKPILVYAPAIEYGLIYPESIIVDEEINIDGYSPSNANKKFLGNVSVRESIEKSLNIPAVKTLSKVGIERAKSFANKMCIEFTDRDKNLALALGGMTEGVTLKQLADAYSTFATKGMFKESMIIKKITDGNGNVLFEDSNKLKKVMKEETASIMTDLLKGVVSNGTARRLNSLGFDVASKTGTVGLTSSNKNTDAFNVSYTENHTIAVWLGSTSDDEYMDSLVNGSTYPTIIMKKLMNEIYKYSKPDNFSLSENLVYKYIDTRSLKNAVVELADEGVSVSNKRLALFDNNNLPEYSKGFEIVVPTLEVSMEEGLKPTMIFENKKDHEYILVRKDVKTGKQEELLSCFGDEKTQKYTDNTAICGQIYEYFLKIKRKGLDEVKLSNSIKLMSF